MSDWRDMAAAQLVSGHYENEVSSTEPLGWCDDFGICLRAFGIDSSSMTTVNYGDSEN